MSFLSVRTAIVDAIKTAIPDLKTVESHGGKFGMADLKHYAVRAPAVVVSNLGGGVMREEGAAKVSPRKWAAFIIARGASDERRDAQAMVIAQELLDLIPSNRWGDDNCHIPENIRDDNLFSIAIDKLGVALWAVTWDQDYDIEPDASGLDDFVTLYGTWELDDVEVMESITTLETET